MVKTFQQKLKSYETVFEAVMPVEEVKGNQAEPIFAEEPKVLEEEESNFF